MRFVSRSLGFDVLVGAVALLVAATSSGATRMVALFLISMCAAWVPFDLLTARRKRSGQCEPARSPVT